jgi:hypothetical protein
MRACIKYSAALNSSAVRGLLLGNLFWAIAQPIYLAFIPFHFSHHNGDYLLYVLNRARIIISASISICNTARGCKNFKVGALLETTNESSGEAGPPALDPSADAKNTF